MSATAQRIKVRRVVWTGAITAITIVGAITGARFKTTQEQKQQIQKARDAPLEDRIAILEEQRGALVAKRMGLEKKIEEVEMRARGATWEESRQGLERKRD